jgi:N-acetylglucosamine repressor
MFQLIPQKRAESGNRDLMVEVNTKLVLNEIRQAESISLTELHKRTPLSTGTIANVINSLKSFNLIEDDGVGVATVGRKPKMLRFNSQVKMIICAEMFADETRLAIMDLDANIEKEICFPTFPHDGPQRVFDDFAKHINDLLKEMNLNKDKILGLGLSFEGMIEPVQGRLLLSSRFGWRNVPVKTYLEELLDINTYVDGEGFAMALGEYYHGSGRDLDNIICLNIDSGLGAISILGGKCCRGRNNMAGEIGHWITQPDGDLCRCGKQGCLETIASGWAIRTKIRNELMAGTKSVIDIDAFNELSTRMAMSMVFEAAEQRDELALNIINDCGKHLGMATSFLINCFDPESVILTGCVSSESKGMLRCVIEKVAFENMLDSGGRSLKIVEGVLGEKAGLYGVVGKIQEEAFSMPAL